MDFEENNRYFSGAAAAVAQFQRLHGNEFENH